MIILLNKQINWFWGWRSKASVSWVSLTFSLKRLNKVKVSLLEFYFWFSLSEQEHFIWMGYTALRCLQWFCLLAVTVWCNPILFSVGWAGDYPLMNRRQEWRVVSSKIKLQRLWLLSGMPFHALSQLTCSKGNQLPFLSHLIDGPLGKKLMSPIDSQQGPEMTAPWMSLEGDPHPVQPMPWLQLDETRCAQGPSWCTRFPTHLNYDIINVCCFKLLYLGIICHAAIEN